MPSIVTVPCGSSYSSTLDRSNRTSPLQYRATSLLELEPNERQPRRDGGSEQHARAMSITGKGQRHARQQSHDGKHDERQLCLPALAQHETEDRPDETESRARRSAAVRQPDISERLTQHAGTEVYGQQPPASIQLVRHRHKGQQQKTVDDALAHTARLHEDWRDHAPHLACPQRLRISPE